MLKESKYVGLTKEERIHATTLIDAQVVDVVTHAVDKELQIRAQSVGIRNDSIQSKAGTKEVWDTRRDSGN